MSAAIRYLVDFSDARNHYISVTADISMPPGAQTLELFLAVWTPGSYMVREYSRYLDSVAAHSEQGSPLPCSTTRKNRWLVETREAGTVRFTYRVYCREMSVRTNWVESGFGFLNGAPTFVAVVGENQRPADIRLVLPPTWAHSVTGLENHPDGQPHHYLAPDYDTLVDSPILAGNPALYSFEIDGIPHLIANEGEDGVWDGARAARDTETILRHFAAMWGGLPYRKYVVLNLLTNARGGLEHKNSMVLMASRWNTRTQSAYRNWLGLVSHEFFHVWNVKRLRPAELGPFDYENENYTRGLWIAEGFTEYFGELALVRCGLDTPANNLRQGLSEQIRTLQQTPGRELLSAEQASHDAWIRLYRPNENSPNTSISYYTKGAVVAWLLDTKIRKATDNTRSLDDLMRAAFTRFSGEYGYTTAEFKALACEIAGTDLTDFFRHTVESTAELDYTEALEYFGLEFESAAPTSPATLGAETKAENGRLLVTKILRNSTAWDSELNVDDEIIAIDNFRVRPDQLTERLRSYAPGTPVELLIARREKLQQIALTLDHEPRETWTLRISPNATPGQIRNLHLWLSA